MFVNWMASVLPPSLNTEATLLPSSDTKPAAFWGKPDSRTKYLQPERGHNHTRYSSTLRHRISKTPGEDRCIPVRLLDQQETTIQRCLVHRTRTTLPLFARQWNMRLRRRSRFSICHYANLICISSCTVAGKSCRRSCPPQRRNPLGLWVLMEGSSALPDFAPGQANEAHGRVKAAASSR